MDAVLDEDEEDGAEGDQLDIYDNKPDIDKENSKDEEEQSKEAGESDSFNNKVDDNKYANYAKEKVILKAIKDCFIIGRNIDRSKIQNI